MLCGALGGFREMTRTYVSYHKIALPAPLQCTLNVSTDLPIWHWSSARSGHQGSRPACARATLKLLAALQKLSI